MITRLTRRISLEPARAEDLDALVTLRVLALRESLERIGRFDATQVVETLRAGFDVRSTRHIRVRAERVGFVVVRRAPSGHLLEHLYIVPAHQNAGVGSNVLQRIMREADAARMLLWVGALRESGANRFYERHGFRKLSEDDCDIYYVRPFRAQGSASG